jgi:hypothetical protein
MKNKIFLLRFCYWWGIISDAVMAFLMLSPNLFVRFMQLDLTPDENFRWGLINAVPLMIGWTLLLYWANQKPIERKDILLLSLPVIAGYILSIFFAIHAGLASLTSMIPILIHQIALSSMIIYTVRKVA